MWKWLINELKSTFDKEFLKRLGIGLILIIVTTIFLGFFGKNAPNRILGLFFLGSVFVCTLIALIPNKLYRNRTFWIVLIACFLIGFALVELIWK